MVSITGGVKKKRVSKKLKSSWRKHVDITDVDNFLEDQRLEERLGKPLSEVADSELFTLDTTLSTAPVLSSKQQKRLRLRETAPKFCTLLQPLTKVPDPIAKRNRVKTKDERKCEILKKIEATKRSKGIFKKRDLQSIKDRDLETVKRKNKPTKFDFDKDIWTTNTTSLKPTPSLDISVQEDQWITGDAERHILHGPGKPTNIIPMTLRKKPSILSAVAIPHPGTSYNPSFEDHQALLNLIVENEQKIIKEEEHLNRVTKDMFKKVTQKQKDSSWLTEMSQGLPNSNEAAEESDGEYKSVNPPTENKQKSLKQRRKQKEQLQLLQQRMKAKVEKKKGADIHKIKFIKKSIEKEQKKALMLHEKRLKALEYKKKEAKRLGRTKFEEPDLDINMGSDITGNLRNLKTEGNLLNDCIKSLQKRNIIEPTLRGVLRKPKVKKYKKAGHKEDWKSTIARPGMATKK